MARPGVVTTNGEREDSGSGVRRYRRAGHGSVAANAGDDEMQVHR